MVQIRKRQTQKLNDKIQVQAQGNSQEIQCWNSHKRVENDPAQKEKEDTALNTAGGDGRLEPAETQ